MSTRCYKKVDSFSVSVSVSFSHPNKGVSENETDN